MTRVRGVWKWLKNRLDDDDTKTNEVQALLEKSEVQMHQAEQEAEEAQEVAESLRALRVQNQFRERMVLKIQGGLR